MSEGPSTAGRRVLLVEDEPALNSALTLRLARAGLLVSSVDSAVSGFLRSSAQRFDAVVLDLGLPHVNGLELLGHLVETAPTIPVVVVTGADEATRERAAALGAARVLGKPASGSAVVGAVTELLAGIE